MKEQLDSTRYKRDVVGATTAPPSAYIGASAAVGTGRDWAFYRRSRPFQGLWLPEVGQALLGSTKAGALSGSVPITCCQTMEDDTCTGSTSF